MTLYLQASEQIKAINNTLDKLDDTSKTIIKRTYINAYPPTKKELINDLYLSRGTFYRRLKRGLLMFAEL